MSELIDITTKTGKKTGETLSRTEVHNRGLWHATAHIWIFNPEEGLLLQKRSEEKESHPGLWDISAAGHIPAGESTINGAVRECAEEVGAFFPPEDFQELLILIQQFEFPENDFYDNEVVTVYLVETNKTLKDFKPQPGEVEDLRFIAPEELDHAVRNREDWLVPHWHEYGEMLERILDR